MWFAILMLGFLMATPTPQRAKSPLDCKNASTQRDLNRCAGDEAARERQRMDRAFAKVVDKRGEREREAIQAAQRAWQAYADAQVEALYPGCGTSSTCGSAHSMCRDVVLSALMRIRTSELERMVREHQLEGDVCVPQSAYREMP